MEKCERCKLNYEEFEAKTKFNGKPLKVRLCGECFSQQLESFCAQEKKVKSELIVRDLREDT